MTEKLKTPATELAVSIEDARKNLSIDGTHLDPRIRMWIEGVTASAEAKIKQRVMAQTWLWIDDAFPDAILLPHPVRSVVAVRFRDAAGSWQQLDLADTTLDVKRYESWLVPAAGRAWPETFDAINSVEVEVVCGIASSAADVPPALRSYVLGQLVEMFDPESKPQKDDMRSSFFDGLLSEWKTYG